MTNEEFMALSIECIGEEPDRWGNINLVFKIKDFWFYLHAYGTKSKSIFSISPWVRHDQAGFCPLCGSEGRDCRELSVHVDTLFHELIQSKNLRLLWLFREYRMESA